MAQHWLKSPEVRDLPLADVYRMSEDEATGSTAPVGGNGEPCCTHCGVADAYRLIRNGRRHNRFKCRDQG